MSVADQNTYLAEIIEELKRQWPDNRAINIVCHGHSVPSGYFFTPMVDTFNAYPHLFHKALKERYPYAVINVIVSAIGGESCSTGAERFESDVLCHKPKLVTIDYSLNDRGLGLEKAQRSWRSMIEAALRQGSYVMLMTPTLDRTYLTGTEDPNWVALLQHANQVRALAAEYEVALVDSTAAFIKYAEEHGNLTDLLSSGNHPNRTGHDIVVREMMRWFAFR